MRKRISSLLSNGIVRSIGGVGGAALFAQLVGLLASPALSRLFSEADFGRFGLFFALANVLATLANLGLPDAILAPPVTDEARGLMAAAFYAALLISPVLGGVTWLLVELNLFGYGALPGWSALVMVPEVMVICMTMTLQLWLIRRQRFRLLAMGHITLGSTRAGAQIASGLANFGFAGLAFSDVISRGAVIVVLARGIVDDLRVARRWTMDAAARVVWRYRMFPLFRTPSTFANNLGTAMPPALVTMAYGVSSAGLFTLMTTVIVAPSSLVQKAVGDVFLGHFAEQYRQDPASARRFLLTVASALLALSFVPAVVLALWGGPAFALLFGAKWRLAGNLAALMVPVLMADFAIGPLGGALNVVNRPDAKLFFDATRLSAYGSAYLIATRQHLPLVGMVALFARLGVIAYVVYACVIYIGTMRPRPASLQAIPQPD